MKRRAFEQRFTNAGWSLKRHGSRHDVWVSKDGTVSEMLPRHPIINDQLAKNLFKKHGI